MAMADSGSSGNALAEASGVDRRNVGRFLAGEQGLTLASASKIAGVLGLRLAGGGARLRRDRK